MEQQRKARNLIVVLLLTIATSSSNQNHYTYTAIDVGSTSINPIVDYTSLRSANTTTSINQDSTTYLPDSTKTDEILDSSETRGLSHYAQPSYSHNEYNEEDDNSDEDFTHHVIPYSVHEDERDVSTRPKYVAPGNWATPPPEKNVPLDFVPVKLHAQVRGTHTVKRLPRREAIESAETDEEKLNAHRLREVVTNSKINTVYTEEGYEDSAYDHAGHVRDADFHEGYARKLHDRQKSGRNSSSGKHRTGKNGNLVPDEFKNYDEDYQDHVEENRKYENSKNNLIDGNVWEGSEIDPKLVVETGIEKLEEDAEKEAEESERNSKVYQNDQESKLHNDIEVDSSESEDSEDDLKDEENKPAKTKKKKVDTLTKEEKKLRKSDQKKKLYDENDETTVDPSDEIKTNSTDVEVSANPQNFLTNSSISQVRYSTDGTSHSDAPIDEPTTISYSQLFWDYFKTKNNPLSSDTSSFFSNSTMNPQPEEERTPIAVATIDGHGPYLFVTTEETTRTPSTFLNSRTFYPELFSDNVNSFGSNSNHNRHLLEHRDDVDYLTNVFATTTDATLPNKTSNLIRSSSSSSENIEHLSSTSILDNATSTSTPTVITLNITKEALSKLDDYRENPFLGPILDNSNIPYFKSNLSKNNTNLKYKVLVRPEPKKSAKSVGDQSSSSRQHASSPLVSQQEDEHKRNRDELSAKYNKMLNYIKNKQTLRSSPEKKKVAYPDFNLIRPPTSQRIAYSIFPTNRPTITNRPSVSVESESLREAKKGLSQDQQHRYQAIKSNPYRFDPFIYVQPVYHKNPLPATKLLPPPLPSIADTYGNYHNNRQNGHHSPLIKPLQQQQQLLQLQRDNAFRYLPLVPDATWRTRSRKKRSGEFHDAIIDVKAVVNNSVTNSSETEKQRDEDTTKLAFPVRSRGGESEASATLKRENSTVNNSESKSADEDLNKVANDSSTSVDEESLLRSQRNVRNKKDHEELLNESPKISGYVIDKEIAARFNDEKDNETSTEIKEEEKIEVEIPDFDYVEELADEEVPEPSTTTEVAVDSKKYPFYNNENVPKASALKYVVDPKLIPRKTPSGMEFYDSRNVYKQCDEIEPNLDEVLPEKEEPNPEREPSENSPRLRGLGDKLDCFKAKYFDENPFDNPLFAEKFIEEPTPPTELNPTKFASKILVLPEENDEYVVHQVSKKPERNGRRMKNRNRPYETQESIRVDYKHDSLNGRGRNAHLHTMRGSKPPVRRLKNQRSRSKSFGSTTTQSPRSFQTASYENQVYEDVMGIIRNMANSYQDYEITTGLPSTQILATAGSENTLKLASAMPSSSREKTTLSPDDTDASTMTYESTSSSEIIRGLVPPPKYLTPQQTGYYRKHRPSSGKSRVLMRSSNIPRIIAHRHTIKINKRSTTNDIAHDVLFKNTDKNQTLVAKSVKDVVENDTVVRESMGETTKETTSMPEIMDLETEESRQFQMQDQNCDTNLKTDVTRNQRNFTNSDESSESPRKTIYTIKDRIRYSKPRWDSTRRFGKFSAKPRTMDEDNRRKEPRYNYFKRNKKPIDDENNYTTLNSDDSASMMKNAPLLTEDGKTSTTEIYRAEESVVYHTIYRNEEEYREPGNAESTVDTKSEKKSAEEETEETTNAYKVHEDVDEDASPTTTKSTSNSKNVLDLREYLESNPPGYEETFSEETTTSSNRYRANVDHEDRENERNEEMNYPKTESSLSNEDSSEKVEEQVETPMKTIKSSAQDDDSEEVASKEGEEGSDKKTFFTYPKRPSSAEHDDESTEKTFYSSFPFSRYKSKVKTDESDEDETKETSEETSEDYVFPWHADKERKESKLRWLQNFDRFEYPWERRERLARERRNKEKRANRFRKMIFDDDDEDNEKEHTKHGRPAYAWEIYDVPSKSRVRNNRRDNLRDISRDFSRRNIDGNSEEYTTEQVLPTARFNSNKYHSRNIRPVKSSSAREISRSIQKVLEEDDFNEEASKKFKDDHSSVEKNSSSSTDKGISRGTLVPEDITQPPRKQDKKRRKIPQPAKNVTDNSDLDSKKVENKEVGDETNKDEYFKLRKNNVNDTEMQIETTTTINQSSELFNSTEEIPATTTQRKKRRRKPLRNNSTISLDNAAAESVVELTAKRRRKSQVSTTKTTTPIMSVTPLARTDLAASKSFFIPVRGRYTRTGEVAKTNELDPFKETITVPETTKFDRLRVKTSTPKTRTIEHRSRVTKQKIVTKTTYPNEADDFNSKINETLAQKQEEENIKPKARRRKKNKRDDDKKYDNNNNSNNAEKLMKQRENERENFNTKFANKDETQKVIISEKPQVRNNFGAQQEPEKQINDLNDENINDENNNTNDFGIMSEFQAYAIKDLLQNISSNRPRSDQTTERTESESNTNEDWKKQSNEEMDENEKEAEEKRRSLLQNKFIKNPERRLYYYIERK